MIGVVAARGPPRVVQRRDLGMCFEIVLLRLADEVDRRQGNNWRCRRGQAAFVPLVVKGSIMPREQRAVFAPCSGLVGRRGEGALV